MKKTICTFMLAICTSAVLHAQPGKERITRIVDSMFYGRRGLIKNKEVPGALIGITYKGEQYFFAYGLADREKGVPMDTETLLEIGSNTKAFTALLLGNELARGTVNNQTKIDAYVPVNKGIANKVRLTDLASFTSGLPTLHDSESMAELMKIDSNNALGLVDDTYLLNLLKKTSRLKNYGQYDYSNFSYGVLGYILCKMNHMDYASLVKSVIFDPLSLRSMTCAVDTNDKRVARGYYEGERAPFITVAALAPAGVIRSDVRDMLQFVQYQMGMPSPLSAAMDITQQTFYDKDRLRSGLCWHKAKRYGHDLWEMRGDTYGQSSLMAFDKQDSLGIVIMLNCMNSELTESMFFRLFTRIIEESPEFKAAYFNRPEVKPGAPVLQSITGTYIMGPGMDAIVSVQKDAVYIQLTGQEPLPIYAVSNNTFQSKEVIASFEFLKDKKGKVDRFVLHQNGQELPAMRK